MENKKRTNRFKKDEEVESILNMLEEHVTPIEKKLTSEHSSSKYPTIFIFGCARSGTTVLHQYLIQNIKCIYPSNFISRFFYAPYLGGLYYKLFTELDHRGELLGGTNKEEYDFFKSDLGKTEGIHSPNEFWYFWRKYFPINDKATIDKQAIDWDQAKRFRNSIYALQDLYSGPFITKGMIANNCIEILKKLFPEALFLFIKRDIFANAKSLYKARIEYYGSPDKWYSFLPKNIEAYHDQSPEEQVARQVIDTNKEIQHSLDRFDNNRTITIEYESFCREPHITLQLLKEADESIQICIDPKPQEFKIREKKGLVNEADKNIKSIIEKIKE